MRENIRDYLEREPFVPFRLVMSSGKIYQVLSPRLAVLLKSELFVALPDGERVAHVPLLHIASIETIAHSRKRSNGRKRG